MKRFFLDKLPDDRNDVLTFTELAAAYLTSVCAPQLRGILHDVARRGSSTSTTPNRNQAVMFLLQIASETEVIEPNATLRKLAFELFCQRVLPRVYYIEDGPEHILRFFATEPQVHQRILTAHRQNVEQFLLQEHDPGERRDAWHQVDPDLLTDATIGAGAYDLLVRLRVLEAIPKLYAMIAQQKTDDESSDQLQCSVWKELSDTSDFDKIKYSLLRYDEQRMKFESDVRLVNMVCGEVHTPKDAYTKRPADAAAALLALVSIVHHRLYG